MARRKKKKPNFLPIILAVILAAAFLSTFSILQSTRLSLSGNIISKTTSISDSINLSFTESGEFIWVPSQQSNIASIKLSGEFKDKGIVKVFVEANGEKYLIFDSSKREGEFIQGKFEYADIKPAFSDIPQDVSTLEPAFNNTIPSELNITDEGYVGTIVEKTEILDIHFSSACVATCSLTGFDQEFYKIVVEVLGSNLKINSIDFERKEIVNTADIIDVLDEEGREIAIHTVRENEDGTYDIDIEFDTSVFGLTSFLTAFQTQNPDAPGAKLRGLKQLPEKLKVKVDAVPNAKIKSVAFATNALAMDNATLTLPKSGYINAILECVDFDLENFTCPSSWKATDIPFVDNGDTITFTVTHFSAYAGGIINESISFSPQSVCGVLTESAILIQDLLSNGTCLIIGADNIVVDGNGFDMTGNGSGFGIDNTGFGNITIKNFAGISNFAYGIYASGMENSNIFNNTIEPAPVLNGFGIYLLNSNSNDIFANTITASGTNGHGIRLLSSSDSIISSNIIATSGDYAHSIYLASQSNGNKLDSNTLETSGANSHGIYLFASSNFNKLDSNTLATSGKNSQGIRIQSSYNSTLSSNTINTQELDSKDIQEL